MAEVVLCRLAKDFRHGKHCVRAVDGLDLRVGAGEIVSIVGPSGCGKTTTLRLVAGLETPTAGRVEINGRDVTAVRAVDRNCAMLFQHDALYPHMSVYDNIAFGLTACGVEKQERNRLVYETAEWLRLTDLLDRRPASLSGGQRKRAALGRALVRNPAVVLLDEPLSYLDAGKRVEIRRELKTALRESQSTALYVTHDHEEAMSVGDRMAVMLDGRLVQVGEPDVVYERPANLAVACMVSHPAMNLWPGDVLASGSVMILRTADGDFPLPRAIAAITGGKLTMGVRADALYVGPSRNSDPGVSLRVDAIERLGSFWDVHGVTTGGRRVVARVPSHGELSAGDVAPLFVDHRRTLYFESGESGASMMYDRIKADN